MRSKHIKKWWWNFKQTNLWSQASSSQFFNASTNGALLTFFGRLFQLLIVLWEKDFALTALCARCCLTLCWWPLVSFTIDTRVSSSVASWVTYDFLMTPSIWLAFLLADAACTWNFHLSFHLTDSNSWLSITYVFLGLLYPKCITLHFFPLKGSCHILNHSSRLVKPVWTKFSPGSETFPNSLQSQQRAYRRWMGHFLSGLVRF